MRLIKDILKCLVRVIKHLKWVGHYDLRFFLDPVQILMDSVEQACDKLIGVVLHRPLEHVIDLPDGSLQWWWAIDVFIPTILGLGGILVPHCVKEFDEHYGDLSMVWPILVLNVQILFESLVFQKVATEGATVTQTLNGTVHIASVAVVLQAHDSSLCSILHFEL